MKDKQHIVVKDRTKEDFEKMKELKGMTQDGLVKYLIKQETARRERGFHE